MKKILAIILSLITLMAVCQPTLAAQNPELMGVVKNVWIGGRKYVYNTNTWYYVDNHYIDFNSNGIPMATLCTNIGTGDVNMLPIRGVAEALGAQIYSQGNDVYRIVLAGKYSVDVKVGDNRVDVRKPVYNTTEYVTTLLASCPVVEYEDTIYIPFRDIVRALFVPGGTMEDTDKYISVSEIVPDSGFYRIYVSTFGKFHIVHKKDLTKTIKIIEPNGGEHYISVLRGPISENFKKYLYRVYVSTNDVHQNYKDFSKYCSYELDMLSGFKPFDKAGEIRADVIATIAPNSMIKNGKLNK